MSIRELLEHFEIEGAYHIKKWNDEVFACVTVAKGCLFECDRWDIDEKILENKITYMYATDGVLNIEVE